MRFSILNLVAAMFIAACLVNALLLVTRTDDLYKATLENQIESKLAETSLVNQESVAKAVETTKADVEILSESKQRLLSAFEAHVDAKYSLTSSEEYLSVIEVPKFQPNELFFIKTYRIDCPKTFKLGVRVFFESRSRMTTNGNGEFESLEEAVLDLPKGLSELNFKFYPPNESGNDCRVAVEINSEEVFSRKFSEQKRRGHSSSNFSFSFQRNYSETEKFPDIVNFQPSAGTTAIRLQVIKADDGSE